MNKSKLETTLDDAKTLRDTLRLQANLAKAEAEDGFDELEAKYESLKVKSKRIAEAAGDTAQELRIAAELGIDADSKEDLETTLELSAEEIRKGYEKIKKIL